jgi:hypothetical protein
MRHIRNLAWFAVGVFIAIVWLVPQAHAQTVDPAFNRIINAIVQNTPGTVTTAIPSGVSSVGTGTANVTTVSGLRIPIPQTGTASVSRAAIAKAAAKIAKGAGVVGVAVTAYQIYDAYQESGYHTCPPPDFFCKPNPATEPYSPGVWDWSNASQPGANGASNPQTACENVGRNAYTYSDPRYTFDVINVLPSSASCRVFYNGTRVGVNTYNFQVKKFPTDCAANFVMTNGQCVYTGTPIPGSPYTEAELEEAFKQKMVDDPAFAKRYYDAIRADNVRHGVLDNSYVLPPDTPLTIYAPTVTTPETTTKTKTVPLSDGTVNTETTKEKVTVTPTTTGTTVSDSKTTYPTTKTETTTTTNNTTNTTTTTTTVTNEAPQNTEPKADDPCIANPNRAGCALLGEPPAAQDIPKEDIPITITPVTFASAASCPAPITFEMYGARSITYEPTCDVMLTLRPLFLAIGAAACAWIFMGALKV